MVVGGGGVVVGIVGGSVGAVVGIVVGTVVGAVVGTVVGALVGTVVGTVEDVGGTVVTVELITVAPGVAAVDPVGSAAPDGSGVITGKSSRIASASSAAPAAIKIRLFIKTSF